MEFKIKKVYVFVALIGIFALLFFLGRLSTRRDRIAAERALSASEDTISRYEVIIAKKTLQVTELSQIVTTKDQAIELGLIEKDKWKKLYYKTIESNTELSAQVTILLDSLKMIKPRIIYITLPSEVDSIPCMVLPTDFLWEDQWAKVVGHFDEQAQASMRIDMPVSLSVVLGTKKRGIPTVSIVEDNPYFTVTDIKSVKIAEKDRWYQSRWLPFGLGFGGATAIFFLLK